MDSRAVRVVVAGTVCLVLVALADGSVSDADVANISGIVKVWVLALIAKWGGEDIALKAPVEWFRPRSSTTTVITERDGKPEERNP